MKYVFAPEGTIGIQSEIIKHSMRGAVNIINIGCVGGINPNLQIGSQVICRDAIRDSGFGHLLASMDEEAQTSEYLNKILEETTTILEGTAVIARVWCVDTLYYTYSQLKEALKNPFPPDVVEMELEAGAITTGWLNANFFKNEPRRYAQIGYISDQVPLVEHQWSDPFGGTTTKDMVPWKIKSFEIAINTLALASKK